MSGGGSGAKGFGLFVLTVSPCLVGRRKTGEPDASAAQFTGGFPAWQLSKLRERESWDHKEEKGVMNFKCINWDLHSLKRGNFINGKSFWSPGKEANMFE